MLGNLIKHEFKATSKIIWPIYLGMVCLAFLTRVAAVPLLESSKNFFFNALSILVIVIFCIGMVALGIMPLVVSAVRFKRNILGQEGYLTMSLPVSTHEIIFSKMITSFVWYIASAVLGFIIIMAMVMWGENINFFAGGFDIKEFFEEAMQLSKENKEIIWHVALVCIELILDAVIAINLGTLLIYASLSIGYAVNKHKGLLTVALIFAFGHITSWVGIGTLIAFGREAEIGIDFVSGIKGFEGFLGIALLIMLAVSAIYYFITNYFISRKLNLE